MDKLERLAEALYNLAALAKDLETIGQEMTTAVLDKPLTEDDMAKIKSISMQKAIATVLKGGEHTLKDINSLVFRLDAIFYPEEAPADG